MTWYDVYVGQADDPAVTTEVSDPNAHNCPDPISPVLYDRNVFDRIVKIGGQTDWGCWVAIVDKAQVLEVFKNASGRGEIAGFLETLKDDQKYAVVARET